MFIGVIQDISEVEYPANGPKMIRTEKNVLNERKPDRLKAF